MFINILLLDGSRDGVKHHLEEEHFLSADLEISAVTLWVAIVLDWLEQQMMGLHRKISGGGDSSRSNQGGIYCAQ